MGQAQSTPRTCVSVDHNLVTMAVPLLVKGVPRLKPIIRVTTEYTYKPYFFSDPEMPYLLIGETNLW